MTYARQAGDYNIVYYETLDYAFKHGEAEKFRMSRRCDYDCCSRIVDMTERWSGDTDEERLSRQMKIVEEFGLERCRYVMAATVRANGRVEFSKELQDWANGIQISDDRFVNATNAIISKSAPILDFIALVQRLTEEEKAADEANAEGAKIEDAKTEGEKKPRARKGTPGRSRTEVEKVEERTEDEKEETQKAEAAQIEGEKAEAEKVEAEQAEAENIDEKSGGSEADGEQIFFEENDAGAEEGADGGEEDILEEDAEGGEDALPTDATRQYGRGGDARPDEGEDGEEGEDGDLRDEPPEAVSAEKSRGGMEDWTGKAKSGWIQIPLPADAVIQNYGKSFYLRMPFSGRYAGYVYNLPATFVAKTDAGYVVSIPGNFEVRLRRGSGDPSLSLSADEYFSEVEGKGEEGYRQTGQSAEDAVEIRLPKSALLERRDRSFRFALPDGFSFFAGKSLVAEDGDGFTVSMRKSYKIDARKGQERREYTPEEVKKTADEGDWENFEAESDVEPVWRKMRVSKKALVYENERRMLFRMPDGKYEDCSYYYPKKLVKDDGDCYVFSFPSDFKAALLQEGSEVVRELDPKDFYAAVCDTGDERYTQELAAPSRLAKNRFGYEQRLRDNVPAEMREAKNWVVVRTVKNAEKNKLDKYLISPATGKFAESDNPETWTDFETACRYARENGGDTLAYALCGNGICCLDIDRCIVDRLLTAKASAAVEAAPRGTYREVSVSGNGLHIFGRLSEPLALRSFSKDGGLEFYRDSHFISMTGNVENASSKLLSFDTPKMRAFLRENFDRRKIYKNAGCGLEGVSVMSDREVLEKAFASKGGDIMKRLFDGEDVKGNRSNSDMALMNRLAFWCNGDKEQMLRLFYASGLYRPEKSQDYYECTVLKAIEGVTDRYDFRQDASKDSQKRPDGPDKGDKGDKT